MCILALYQWLVLRGIFAVFHSTVWCQVHRAVDVREAVVACTFVLHWATGVFCLRPLIRLLEVLAIACLIAQRPEDDAGVIEVALHVALVALHVGFLIVGTLSQCSFAIAHAMTLDVGFCHHIDAILVAQIIPVVVVWIVRGAHSVDVKLLHDLDVLQHALLRHHVATVWIQFMTVGSLEEHGLSVHQHLCILDFYLAEAHLDGDHLQHLSTLHQLGTQCI